MGDASGDGAYVGAYLWVEGDDDERFVQSVFSDFLAGRYKFVIVQKYRTMKTAKIKAFLESIESMGHDCYFFGDLDHAANPEVRERELRLKYGVPTATEVLVVCRMIEGWYLAGVPDGRRSGLWAGGNLDVNQVDKAAFDRGMPSRFRSRIDWMIELLKAYQLRVGCARSHSLNSATGVLGGPGGEGV